MAIKFKAIARKSPVDKSVSYYPTTETPEARTLKLITDEIYDGRYYDPTCVAARNAVDTLAQYADGVVKLSLYKGNIIFDSLTECPHTIYNEADSSMEASDGVNPVSSQGFAEIQSVEARMLALSGQIEGR